MLAPLINLPIIFSGERVTEDLIREFFHPFPSKMNIDGMG